MIKFNSDFRIVIHSFLAARVLKPNVRNLTFCLGNSTSMIRSHAPLNVIMKFSSKFFNKFNFNKGNRMKRKKIP